VLNGVTSARAHQDDSGSTNYKGRGLKVVGDRSTVIVCRVDQRSNAGGFRIAILSINDRP